MSKSISIRNVTKFFGEGKERVDVLDSLSFEVESNTFVAILGPSGCGKSTLLSMIDGLLDPSSGEILVDGKQVTKPQPDRAMVFQDFALFPWQTVEENIALGLDIQGASEDEQQAIAHEWIEKVGLEGFAEHYPYELSGGMKQRVGLARALAVDPDVLLMDEPFGALDAQTKDTMQTELLRLLQEQSKTVLFVTHDITEAVYLADKIVVMSKKPATIIRDLSVEFDRPRWRRKAEITTHDRFTEYERTLRSDLGLDLEA